MSAWERQTLVWHVFPKTKAVSHREHGVHKENTSVSYGRLGTPNFILACLCLSGNTCGAPPERRTLVWHVFAFTLCSVPSVFSV